MTKMERRGIDGEMNSIFVLFLYVDEIPACTWNGLRERRNVRFDSLYSIRTTVASFLTQLPVLLKNSKVSMKRLNREIEREGCIIFILYV